MIHFIIREVEKNFCKFIMYGKSLSRVTWDESTWLNYMQTGFLRRRTWSFFKNSHPILSRDHSRNLIYARQYLPTASSHSSRAVRSGAVKKRNKFTVRSITVNSQRVNLYPSQTRINTNTRRIPTFAKPLHFIFLKSQQNPEELTHSPPRPINLHDTSTNKKKQCYRESFSTEPTYSLSDYYVFLFLCSRGYNYVSPKSRKHSPLIRARRRRLSLARSRCWRRTHVIRRCIALLQWRWWLSEAMAAAASDIASESSESSVRDGNTGISIVEVQELGCPGNKFI